MRSLTAGTRGSALALWQTEYISARLKQAHGIEVRLEVITTRGDVDMSERLVGKLEKGFFTVELEEALRAQRVDFAVHSLKDLPTRDPEGLTIIATPERAKPHDLLICRKDRITGVRDGRPMIKGRIGASSLRRSSLIMAHLKDSVSAPLRGNVPTRIKRLADVDYDAIVLARAGVERLQIDLSAFSVFALDPRKWMPAPGQGAIAVQARSNDAQMTASAAVLDHAPTRAATSFERAFLTELEGGCTTPFGCYINDGKAWLGLADGSHWRTLEVATPAEANAAFIKDTLAALRKAPPAKDDRHDTLFEQIG